MFGGNTMKKRIITILIVFALANSMAFTNAFVVNTKAVSSEQRIAKIVDGLKDSVNNYHRTHIKDDDGNRTIIDEDYKQVHKKNKKRTIIPSSYMAPYTSVKDQAYFGACWMFGEMSSLESNLMNKSGYQGGLVGTDPIDLSEAQGVYTQYNKMTVDGTINGAAASDSDNDREKYDEDSYYGYNEGGWVLDASMCVSANKGAALENDNPYLSTSGGARNTESKTMSEIAAAQYRLNRFNIQSAEQLPEIFAVTGTYGNYNREYDPSVRDIWKTKIVDNGAISANYKQSTSSIYNHYWGEDASKYEIGPNFWIYNANVRNWYSTNHVITIVGFDDDYSRFNYAVKYTSQNYDSLVGEIVYIKMNGSNPDMTFDSNGHIDTITYSDTEQEGYQAFIVPKEDGAWHIKNSYGTGTANSKRYDYGIMHMSYCEETLSEAVSSVVEEDLNQIQNNEKTYDTTLSHSSLMGNVGIGFGDDAKASEIYTISSEKDVELGQIGYWTGEDNTTTRVKIYSGLSSSDEPESGTEIYDSGDVEDSYLGYHTIELDDEITLAHGTKISAVISQECDGDCALMMELDYANTAEAYYFFNSNRGDTFYYDGSGWTDSIDFDTQARTQGYTVGNSTLKLFGNEKEIEPETTTTNKYTVTVDGVETEVEEGQNFTFPTTSENGYANSDYSTLYASGQTITPEEDITVSSIGDIDFEIQPGASIDLTGKDGIRFLSKATHEDSDFLNSDNVELGTLLAPYDIVNETFEGELDLDIQARYGNKYAVKVINQGWNAGIVGNYAAGIIHINQFNWGRELIARGYMKIKYSDGTEKILYTELSDKRSIVQVATGLKDAGYPGMTEAQIQYIQKFLN